MNHDDFTISNHFGTIEDPRKYNIQHELIDIITIAICAIICGAENWVDVEQYGRSKYEWLKQFLRLPNGIPSHDTFGIIFSLLDPEQFNEAFTRWWQSIQTIVREKHVAIDGKTLRGSHDKAINKSAIHVISAWAVENGIVLGQVKTDEKSNEITAIPELIKQLELKGAVVSIDAMGCQKVIAQEIVDKQADYVFSLKGNHGFLHDQIKTFFQDNTKEGAECDCYESTDGGHGRIEIRRYATTDDIEWLQGKEQWAGLKTIIMVHRERHVDEKVNVETSYYISSMEKDAERIGHAIRNHWQIENSLHWVLDVSFDEDRCRIRKNHAPANMATLRHIALNLIKQEKTFKGSVKTKRLKAAWENSYLMKILSL